MEKGGGRARGGGKREREKEVCQELVQVCRHPAREGRKQRDKQQLPRRWMQRRQRRRSRKRWKRFKRRRWRRKKRTRRRKNNCQPSIYVTLASAPSLVSKPVEEDKEEAAADLSKEQQLQVDWAYFGARTSCDQKQQSHLHKPGHDLNLRMMKCKLKTEKMIKLQGLRK